MKPYKLILLLGLLVFNVDLSSAQTPVSKFGLRIADANPGTVSNSPRLQANAIISGTPPNIVYPTPQVYALNQPIPALQPVNIGGAVPPAVYGQVSTVTGGTLLSGNPSGIAVDLSGNCYYTEYQQGAIVKISTAGIPTKLNFVNTPAGLAIDQHGNLFVTDLDDCQIYKIDPNGVKTVFAGTGAYGSTDGPGLTASFSNPAGICIDSQDNLYVIDKNSGKIRKITPAGVVSTVYLGNYFSFVGADGISIDGQGNIYVADSPNYIIQKVSTTGVVTDVAGNGAPKSIDGTGVNAGFYYPTGITIDSQGNLYVCDYRGLKIRKITPAGVVTTIAGSGNSGLTNGIGTAASFEGPLNTAFDPTGNSLYITDFAGGIIKRLALSGYAIDKALPAGLLFDPTTGIISGTPTVLSSPTNYTITAYNGYGSSQAVVNISVTTTAVITLLPSLITLPAQQPGMLGADNYYDPQGSSTNKETPITYTSSDPSVAYITADGRIKVLKPGIITITAHQVGNSHYTAALPVSQPVTFTEYLAVLLPPISNTTACAADFDAGGIGSDIDFPLVYSSSNPAVATVSSDGHIHIVGAGSTTITLSEPGKLPLYVSAPPQTQTFNVTVPVLPTVSITADAPSPCLGSSVTFTATPQNAGKAPAYQWQVNGVNAGTNAITFSSNTLADGDQVSCILSNTDNSCISTYPATSNVVIVSRITPSAPTVSIAASVSEILYGTPVTFTATVKNVNGPVSYQWTLNGMQAGTNSQIYNSSTLNDGDVITCLVTPSAACSTPGLSDPVTMTVVPLVVVPNTFTPNGDGVNDLWKISGIGSYPNCLVNIYNRYGKLVYQSKGYQTPWDGTVSGTRAPVSTYYYVIDLGFKNNVLGGSVTVLR